MIPFLMHNQTKAVLNHRDTEVTKKNFEQEVAEVAEFECRMIKEWPDGPRVPYSDLSFAFPLFPLLPPVQLHC
jgi:hypothetical protein